MNPFEFWTRPEKIKKLILSLIISGLVIAPEMTMATQSTSAPECRARISWIAHAKDFAANRVRDVAALVPRQSDKEKTKCSVKVIGGISVIACGAITVPTLFLTKPFWEAVRLASVSYSSDASFAIPRSSWRNYFVRIGEQNKILPIVMQGLLTWGWFTLYKSSAHMSLNWEQFKAVTEAAAMATPSRALLKQAVYVWQARFAKNPIATPGLRDDTSAGMEFVLTFVNSTVAAIALSQDHLHNWYYVTIAVLAGFGAAAWKAPQILNPLSKVVSPVVAKLAPMLRRMQVRIDEYRKNEPVPVDSNSLQPDFIDLGVEDATNDLQTPLPGFESSADSPPLPLPEVNPIESSAASP